jgi:VWFA-related protein
VAARLHLSSVDRIEGDKAVRLFIHVLLAAWCSVNLLGVFAPPATAQSAGEQTITVDVDLVNIYFTVCNSNGRLVANLDRESFSIFEDGDPQIVTNFSRETDIPLTIVLLIDTSGSVRDKLQFEKKAAIDFLYATLRRGRDKAALFTFDTALELHQDFTDDPSTLADAIKRIRAGGGTRLYDGLYSVMKDKLAGTEERKAIVLITDGNDNSSKHSPDEVVELAQRNNVSVYAVSMNALGIRWPDSDQSDSALDRLGSETGGRAFFPAKLDKLGAHFKKIGNELRSQYTIAYRSTNPKKDGTFRKVRIDVKKVRHSVRARSGYFAPS